MTAEQRILDYAVRLRVLLREMPEPDRDAIVTEIRTHLQECHERGRLDLAMKDLGSPEHLARAYFEELRIEASYVNPTPARTVGTLAILASQHVLAALGLLVCSVGYLLAGAFLLTALVDLVRPDAVGLWTGQHIDGDPFMYFGWVDVADHGLATAPAEILGPLYPLVATAGALVFFVISDALGRLFLKRMRKPKPVPNTQ